MTLSNRMKVAKTTGRLVGSFSRKLNLGRGSVLPGRVGLTIEPELLQKSRRLFRQGCVFITGTNGKSTTTYYLSEVLRSLGYSVCSNRSGANMLSGISSACLTLEKPVDYGIFEVDEASVPKLARYLKPTHLVLLNLSRDQLDRYAEIEQLATKLLNAAKQAKIKLIYNYANSYTGLLGYQYKNSIGYCVKQGSHIATLDRPICPICSSGLISYSEEDGLNCTYCKGPKLAPQLVTYYRSGLLRVDDIALGCPTPQLAETLTATVQLALNLGMDKSSIIEAIQHTKPKAAHHMVVRDSSAYRYIDLQLAKNPASFTQSLRQIATLALPITVLVVNRNIADGEDTSWLWDVDFSALLMKSHDIYIAGQAAFDLSLRLEVAGVPHRVFKGKESLIRFLSQQGRQAGVIANYTAYQWLKDELSNKIRRKSDPLISTLEKERYEGYHLPTVQ